MDTNFKDTFFSRNLSINCNGKLLDLSTPKVMGILNITPDSFYDGGRYFDSGAIKSRVQQMIDEGADIIDIGAFSSRPGAKIITEKEEFARLSHAMEMILNKFDGLILSVDTFRTSIAKRMIEDFQVAIINDISAGEGDPEMFDFIADSKVPYIIMHMQGEPETMQYQAKYQHVVNDLLNYFNKKVDHLIKKGVNDVIIDPGFGFGKTLAHNYELLSNLEAFKIFGLPLLIGLSRKSMVYKTLDTDSQGALNGTTALNMYGLIKGANIIRVHDVKEAVETVKLFEKLDNS